MTEQESQLKIAVSGIKKETLSSSKKYTKFIKFLKNFASVSCLNFIWACINKRGINFG